MMKVHVANTDAVPEGSGKEFLAGGKAIALWNLDGQYYATSARCPHADAPLCMSTPTADGEICCAMHGWRFDIKTGKSIAPPNRNLSTWVVHVEDGAISVEMPDEE